MKAGRLHQGAARVHVVAAEIRAGAQPVCLLDGGPRNTNYRVRLGDAPHEVVLRLCTADVAACAREASLLRLVAERVPVPAVLRSEARARPAWMLLEWVDGIHFDQMLVHAEAADVEHASRSAGEVLAAIHSFSLPSPGFLGANLEIAEPMGYSWLTGVVEFFGQDRARQLVGATLGCTTFSRCWSRRPVHSPLECHTGLGPAHYQDCSARPA